MNTFTVCIPAAGAGTRMGGATPKQYLHVLGREVLLHTLDRFDAMSGCEHIIIATDDRGRVDALLGTKEWRTPIICVAGGAQRQDSVANAIAAVQDDDAIVIIHDAARPCVRPEHVQAVADAVAARGAAVLAIPARDTLKQVADARVQHTIDRSVVWQAQTPQGAKARTFRQVFSGMDAAQPVTDDVSLLEAAGIPVHVVEGAFSNIKITTEEDLLIAEALLAAGRERS